MKNKPWHYCKDRFADASGFYCLMSAILCIFLQGNSVAECLTPTVPEGPHFNEWRNSPPTPQKSLVPMTAEGIVGMTGGHNQKTPISLAEAKQLEPACILVFANGGTMTANGMWHDRVLMDNPIFNDPQYSLARGAISFHHYCWAKVAEIRYFKESNPGMKDAYLSSALNDLAFVVDSTGFSTIEWKKNNLPMVLTTRANLALYAKNTRLAIQSTQKAISINPYYDRAFYVQANIYIQQDNKKKALETLALGLKHNPNSKSLKRLYTSLGGKQLPDDEICIPETTRKPTTTEPPLDNTQPEKTQPTKDTPTIDSHDAKNEGVSNNKSNSTNEQQAVTSHPPEDKDKKAKESQPATNKNNPFCRFCP